jgi:hypothetical protein
MIKGNKEKPPPPNKSEILRVCIQLYSYHDRSIKENELSIGALYHEIFGNDGRLEFNSFKSDIDFLNSNALIPLKNNILAINNEVAKTLIDYFFTLKDEIGLLAII